MSGQTAAAATGDIGHADQTYSGVSNPPTADKPQSKLWFNDGLWWADMWTSSGWHIFRLDRSAGSWVDTGTAVDSRGTASADALWDGSKLYIGTQYVTVSDDTTTRPSQSQPARLYRYSYSSATKKYTLDSGFPSTISSNSSESLTIDKDTTGRVWATWTKVSGSSSAGYSSKVYVNSSADGSSWGTPMVVPASGANTSVAPDDISAVVAYGKSSAAKGSIGVLWSNHLDNSVYWATHKDGDPLGTWKGSIAVRGTKQADDHLNLKTIDADAQGRVVAAVKTSLDELSTSKSTDPQINVLTFKPGTGSWTSVKFGTLADCHTRPLVMLDSTNNEIHVFATAPTESGCAYAGKPGTIYEKTTSLDNPSFVAGRGTPVIRDADSANMNNVTSSKQSVTSASGLVVLASNNTTKQYWHADETLRGASTGTGTTRTVTLNPTADTMVKQASPGTSYGSTTTLSADAQETSGTSSAINSYLRFTVPALASGESITSAKLSLNVTNGSPNGPAVYRTATTWTESTMTWSSGRPARSSSTAVGNFGSVAVARDSTAVSGVTAAGAVSFELAPEVTDGVLFSSRENGTTGLRPQLILTITS